jgi:hypothetical protein
MSTFESSFKSLLQGVSQQQPEFMQVGQVTEQVNMVSDPVSGLRRRPGTELRFKDQGVNYSQQCVTGMCIDLNGKQVHILINSMTGTVQVRDLNYGLLATPIVNHPYLKVVEAQYIQTAVVGGEFFICNTSAIPVKAPDPDEYVHKGTALIYVRAGAFNKKYEIRYTVRYSEGGLEAEHSGTVAYTTPDGSHAGDADLADPTNVALQLSAQLNLAIGDGLTRTATSLGSSVYVKFSGKPILNISIESNLGSSYVVCASPNVVSEGDLPPRLPSVADGIVLSVGSVKYPTYYKYVAKDATWLECAKVGSTVGWNYKVPLSIYFDGTWKASGDGDGGTLSIPFEGRAAGDDTTSPDPAWSKGITGMSSYQGRLVLLAGSMVCMSATNKPRRFYRSTVTSVLDSDNIEVGASANTSATYTRAVQYQKSLLLFSRNYQAVVPSTTGAITPRNAMVVITGEYNATTNCAPVVIGRTLMYPSLRAANYFGLMEVTPSTQIEAQFVSTDATSHLPTYFPGECRLAASSGVSGMAVFGSTTDYNSLWVHEYVWSDQNKVQQAWHRWEFPVPVASAYFSQGLLWLFFVTPDTGSGNPSDKVTGYVGTLDPKLSMHIADVPYLDLYTPVTTQVDAGPVAYPADTYYTHAEPKALSRIEGAPGEVMGYWDSALDAVIKPSTYTSETCYMGFSYLSYVVPPQPVLRQQDGSSVISEDKLTVLKYTINTTNSGEYVVKLTGTDGTVESYNSSTLYYTSPMLVLGAPQLAAYSMGQVPVRMRSTEHALRISTEGTRELNVKSIGYTCRTHQKIRRF